MKTGDLSLLIRRGSVEIEVLSKAFVGILEQYLRELKPEKHIEKFELRVRYLKALASNISETNLKNKTALRIARSEYEEALKEAVSVAGEENLIAGLQMKYGNVDKRKKTVREWYYLVNHLNKSVA